MVSIVAIRLTSKRLLSLNSLFCLNCESVAVRDVVISVVITFFFVITFFYSGMWLW